MKTIAWPENLDKDGEYDEYHDFSQAVMFVSNIETVATVTKKMTANESTLDFNQEVTPDEVSSVNFGLGVWVSNNAKIKGKRALDYTEEGFTQFSINLADENLQRKFNRLCADPVLGLATFVKQCYEAGDYEIIEES